MVSFHIKSSLSCGNKIKKLFNIVWYYIKKPYRRSRVLYQEPIRVYTYAYRRSVTLCIFERMINVLFISLERSFLWGVTNRSLYHLFKFIFKAGKNNLIFAMKWKLLIRIFFESNEWCILVFINETQNILLFLLHALTSADSLIEKIMYSI